MKMLCTMTNVIQHRMFRRHAHPVGVRHTRTVRAVSADRGGDLFARPESWSGRRWAAWGGWGGYGVSTYFRATSGPGSRNWTTSRGRGIGLENSQSGSRGTQ